MRKLYLVLLFIAGVCQAQIVDIPDANFKARLIELGVDTDADGEIQETEADAFSGILNLEDAGIDDFTGMAAFQNITSLFLSQNSMTSLEITNLPNVSQVVCRFCPNLVSVNLVNLPSMISASISDNPQLATLDFSQANCNQAVEIHCMSNALETINVDNLPGINEILAESNYLMVFDASHCGPITANMNFDGNPLQYLFLKNGFIDDPGVIDITSQVFICADEAEIEEILSSVDQNVVSGFEVNSYCSFEPGGDYNTITGTVVFDSEANGCDDNVALPYIKVILNDGTDDFAAFTNNTGNYTFYTGAGDFLMVPQFENDYFTPNPSQSSQVFEDNLNNVATHNFCISANGINPDIEVIVSPQGSPIPGFPATYQVALRNKGNQMITSSNLGFAYEETQMDYSASAPEATISNGFVSWSYQNLMPFETRTYFCNMVIHAPTDDFPVNSGDEVTVSGFAGYDTDVDQNDNQFTLTQTAVNSFDPNDILCLEGELQPTSAIGDYLHYRVRFENTGTAPAQNIVVRVPIDQQRFQLESLQLISASHAVRATIRDSIAEFMFQSINLDSGGHGNVLLKVRSAGNLEQGDSVINGAGIYFDYNFPILTNEAETVFQDLSTANPNHDASIVVFPNPANDHITIASANDIEKIEVYDVHGRLLQVSHASGREVVLKLTYYATGNYFVRVSSDRGSSVQKIIKQ